MDNIELLAKARSYGNMSDEDFDREALNNGFSPEEIEASKTYMPQPTMQQAPQEPIAQQPTMQQPTIQQESQASVRPSIDELKQTYRGKVDLRKQKDFLKEQGYSDEELKKLDDTFEVMDDQMFENFVTDLANGKSFKDIGLDLATHFAQGAKTQEDLEAAATEAARLVQNFKITRMLKNRTTMMSEDMFRGMTKTDLKNMYPTLSDNDIQTILKTDLTPSFLDALTDWSGVSRGVQQDWLGARKALANLGLGEFTEEDESEIKNLALEEKKNEIRTNAWLGIDSSDASPLMLASLLAKSLVIAVPVGAATGYAYSLGQGDSETEARISAGLGGVLPIVFKGLEKLYPKASSFFGKIKSSDTQMAKDLAQELRDVNPEVLEKTIDFAEKYGYKINVGSIVPENSNTYLIARTAKSYSTILGSMGDVLNMNSQALDRAVEATLKELHNNPVTAKLVKKVDRFGNESQIVEDPITQLIKTNLDEAQVKLADDIRKTYDDFSKLAKDIPADTGSTNLVDELLQYRDNLPITLEGTVADKFKDKLDELIVNNFKNKMSGITLADIDSLAKSVGKLAKSSKDPEIIAIKAQFREYLTDLKIKRLQLLSDTISTKEVRTPVEEALLEKIPKALDIQYQAKELYKTKRSYFIDKANKEYIGKFVQERGAEVMSDLLYGATTEQLSYLKSAFNLVGKGQDFQQIGKRIVIDRMARVFNTETRQYSTRGVVTELENLLNDTSKMELFGFDKEATDSLKYLYRVASAQQNFYKLFHRDFQTTNQQISVINRMLNSILDSIRGLFALKSLPSNKEIKNLASKIRSEQSKIDKMLSNKEFKEVAKKFNKYTAFKAATQATALNPEILMEAGKNGVETINNWRGRGD